MIIKKRAILDRVIFERVPWIEGEGSICDKCNPDQQEEEENDEDICTLCDIIIDITGTSKSNIHYGYLYVRKKKIEKT